MFGDTFGQPRGRWMDVYLSGVEDTRSHRPSAMHAERWKPRLPYGDGIAARIDSPSGSWRGMAGIIVGSSTSQGTPSLRAHLR